MSMIAAFAGGLFGGLNKANAEKRASATAAVKASRDAQAASLKAWQERVNNKEFQANLLLPGFLEAVKPNLESLGAGGENILEQMSVLANRIEEEEGMESYGEKFNFKLPDKNLERYDFHYLNSLAKYIQTPNGFNALEDLRINHSGGAMNHYQALLTNIASAGNRFITKTVGDLKGKDEKFQYYIDIAETFGGLKQNPYFMKDLKEIGGLNIFDANVNNVEKTVKQQEGNTYFFKGFKNDNGVSKSVPFTPSEKEKKVLLQTSQYLGIPMQEVIDKWGAYSNTVLGNADPESPEEIYQAYLPFKKALEIAPYNPNYLDPASDMAGTMKDDDLFSMGEILFGNNGKAMGSFKDTDFMGMTNALAFHMIHSPEKQTTQYGGNVYAVSKEVALDYVIKNVFGRGADKISAKDGIRYINEGVTNTAKTSRRLNQLLDITSKEQLTGPAANLWSSFSGIFGLKDLNTGDAGGFISQLANKMGVTLDDDLKASMEQRLSSSTSAQLGKAEALRIVLAFEMARAFDPSGRLSNQDVEIQLTRLGGSNKFRTVSAALASIQLAIEDINDKNQYFSLLQTAIKPAGGDTRLTPINQARIDAALAVRTIMEGHRRHEFESGNIKNVSLAEAQRKTGTSFRFQQKFANQNLSQQNNKLDLSDDKSDLSQQGNELDAEKEKPTNRLFTTPGVAQDIIQGATSEILPTRKNGGWTLGENNSVIYNWFDGGWKNKIYTQDEFPFTVTDTQITWGGVQS